MIRSGSEENSKKEANEQHGDRQLTLPLRSRVSRHTITHISAKLESPRAGHSESHLLKSRPITTEGAKADEDFRRFPGRFPGTVYLSHPHDVGAPYGQSRTRRRPRSSASRHATWQSSSAGFFHGRGLRGVPAHLMASSCEGCGTQVWAGCGNLPLIASLSLVRRPDKALRRDAEVSMQAPDHL